MHIKSSMSKVTEKTPRSFTEDEKISVLELAPNRVAFIVTILYSEMCRIVHLLQFRFSILQSFKLPYVHTSHSNLMCIKLSFSAIPCGKTKMQTKMIYCSSIALLIDSF